VATIAGILFDKDGTLFDFNATWAVWTSEVLTELAAGDQDLLTAMGHAIGFDPEIVRFEPGSVVIAGTALEIAQALADVLGDVPAASLLDQMNARAAQAPQVEVTPLGLFFNGLKQRGLKVGVATNDAEAPARVHLERANVLEAMDFVAGSDSGFGGKPDAGQLLGFCKATGLSAAQCIMVGDSTHDLQAGRLAGFKTVGVLTGPATRAVLAPIADVVLNSIAELPQYLDGLDANTNI